MSDSVSSTPTRSAARRSTGAEPERPVVVPAGGGVVVALSGPAATAKEVANALQRATRLVSKCVGLSPGEFLLALEAAAEAERCKHALRAAEQRAALLLGGAKAEPPATKPVTSPVPSP